MIIIISGLPGTGKTSICKQIECKFDYKYINDWDIFKSHNISFDKLKDKNEISKKYSQLIIDYIIDNKEQNLVVDLEYSISPTVFAKSELPKISKIIFLGFVQLPIEILHKLFQKHNPNLSYMELWKKLEFYKSISEDYQEQCNAYNLEFKDIIMDKNLVIDEIINNLKI